MPIHIYWDDTLDAVLRIDITVDATWDDFEAMFGRIDTLIHSQTRYDVILFTAAHALEGNTATHFKRLNHWLEHQANLGLFVMIDPTLAGMVSRLNHEETTSRSIMVRSLDDAYVRIQQHREA